MSILEYDACFYALSRFFPTSISTKLERIRKFVKGLQVFLVVYKSYGGVMSIFLFIVEYTKMLQLICEGTQGGGGAQKTHHQGDFNQNAN